MKRIICIITALVLTCAFALSEDVTSVYETIQMSDTLNQIREKLGEGEEIDDFIRYGDVLLAFYESGRLQAKGLYFDDISEVAAKTQADFALVRKFKQGTPLSELTAILGEGKEIMTINLADEENANIRKLLAWQNEDGGILEALIELDDDEWLVFALGEIA